MSIRSVFGLFLLCGFIVFQACTKKEGTPKPEGAPKFSVGLLLDKGGRDDKSFNSAAFQGAMKAEKELGVTVKVLEASDDSSIEPSLRNLAQREYGLVIGIGFSMEAALKKVAAEFPQKSFLQIDAKVAGPNVRSVMFKEHEGSFLVGALAAMASPHKIVGFIGGMDIPLIRRFELGYRKGAQYIDGKTKVLSNYVGASSDAWRNPTKAKELATHQYGSNADVIFVAAGASNFGAFDAAEELKKLVIGVDSNQNWIKPGKVLTSMVKKVDTAVFDTIKLAKEGKFKGEVTEWGFAEGGIDYALDEHNRSLITPEMEKKINEIKQAIQEHKIKVPDYYIESERT